MKLFALLATVALAAAASSAGRAEMESITGIALPGKPTPSLRASTELADADLETAKSIVSEAIRRMQADAKLEGRNLGWGLCLTFWDCDESTTEHTLEKMILGIKNSQQLDDLQAAIREWSSFDARFDIYTYIIAITNTIEVNNWEAAYPPLGRPSAQEHVLVPTVKQDVEDVPCGLAYNEEANAVVVPKTDEHFQDVARASSLLSLGIAENLGYPLTADLCGKWGENEDASQALKSRLFGSWPEHRVQVPWGENRMGDGALEELVFYGIGQHRVQRVCTASAGGLAYPACAGRTEDANAPAGAHYAVYLDFAEGLEVREGFAKLGGTAYFDRNGAVLSIHRLGASYYPSSGPQGHSAVASVCTSSWGWKRSCSRWYCPYYYWTTETCTDPVAAEYGWRNAKMAFRGTLSAVTTAIDHLYGLHLSVANAIVTANVEELEPNHPLRRLMTPFGYRTEAINYRASFALVNEFGLVHRAFPLSKKGLVDLFDFARTKSAGLTWAPIPLRHLAKGVNTVVLPLDQDGDEYYRIIETMVRRYLERYYPNDSCAADAGIQAWHLRVNSIAPNHDLPPLETCAELQNILATFMYLVSAGHRHVGTIAAELEDPCFAPWSWKAGGEAGDETGADVAFCGLPRTSYTQVLTMALTSHEQPRIMEDYTHMFEEEEAKGFWRDFTAELAEFGKTVDSRNVGRRRPFLVFDVDQIETSVGI